MDEHAELEVSELLGQELADSWRSPDELTPEERARFLDVARSARAARRGRELASRAVPVIAVVGAIGVFLARIGTDPAEHDASAMLTTEQLTPRLPERRESHAIFEETAEHPNILSVLRASESNPSTHTVSLGLARLDVFEVYPEDVVEVRPHPAVFTVNVNHKIYMLGVARGRHQLDVSFRRRSPVRRANGDVTLEPGPAIHIPLRVEVAGEPEPGRAVRLSSGARTHTLDLPAGLDLRGPTGAVSYDPETGAAHITSRDGANLGLIGISKDQGQTTSRLIIFTND